MTTGWIAGTAGLLAALLVGIEWPRFGGARRIVRVLLVGGSVACLALLALPPGAPPASVAERAVLITPGAAADAIHAARRSGMPLVAVGVDGVSGADEVADLGTVARRHPRLRNVVVLGHGLPEWEWQRLPARVERVEAQALAAGVESVAWQRERLFGEPLVARGRLTEASGSGTLELHGPGGPLASLEIDGHGPREFALRTVPPRRGELLYRLVWTPTAGGEAFEDSLDVEVRDAEPLAVLWLEDAPRFETRGFARWLAGRGDGLVVRQTLTRGRTRIERHHHPEVNVARLTSAVLAEFDLLVLDVRTAGDLDPGERTALDGAVRDGLGVLLLPHERERPPRPEFLTRWDVTLLDDVDQFAARTRFSDGTLARPLTLEPRTLDTGAGVAPLLTDDAGRVLAAVRERGRGRVGFSLVADTFRWRLEGHAEDHARYWSEVVAALARPRIDPRWRLPVGPLPVNEPLRLFLDGTTEVPECTVRSADSVYRLAPRQDPLDPARWEATFRPRRDGLHTVSSEGGTSSFRVAPPGSWIAWRQSRDRDATALRIAVAAPGALDTPAPRSRRIPRGLVFALFLAFVAALWLDERR